MTSENQSVGNRRVAPGGTGVPRHKGEVVGVAITDMVWLVRKEKKEGRMEDCDVRVMK